MSAGTTPRPPDDDIDCMAGRGGDGGVRAAAEVAGIPRPVQDSVVHDCAGQGLVRARPALAVIDRRAATATATASASASPTIRSKLDSEGEAPLHRGLDGENSLGKEVPRSTAPGAGNSRRSPVYIGSSPRTTMGAGNNNRSIADIGYRSTSTGDADGGRRKATDAGNCRSASTTGAGVTGGCRRTPSNSGIGRSTSDTSSGTRSTTGTGGDSRSTIDIGIGRTITAGSSTNRRPADEGSINSSNTPGTGNITKKNINIIDNSRVSSTCRSRACAKRGVAAVARCSRPEGSRLNESECLRRRDDVAAGGGGGEGVCYCLLVLGQDGVSFLCDYNNDVDDDERGDGTSHTPHIPSSTHHNHQHHLPHHRHHPPHHRHHCQEDQTGNHSLSCSSSSSSAPPLPPSPPPPPPFSCPPRWLCLATCLPSKPNDTVREPSYPLLQQQVEVVAPAEHVLTRRGHQLVLQCGAKRERLVLAFEVVPLGYANMAKVGDGMSARGNGGGSGGGGGAATKNKELTSKIFGRKIVKSENVNVKSLVPRFYEKGEPGKGLRPTVTLRVKGDRTWQIDRYKRRSDLCDVQMYRSKEDPSEHHSEPKRLKGVEGQLEGGEPHSLPTEPCKCIRLCGIALGTPGKALETIPYWGYQENHAKRHHSLPPPFRSHQRGRSSKTQQTWPSPSSTPASPCSPTLPTPSDTQVSPDVTMAPATPVSLAVSNGLHTSRSESNLHDVCRGGSHNGTGTDTDLKELRKDVVQCSARMLSKVGLAPEDEPQSASGDAPRESAVSLHREEMARQECGAGVAVPHDGKEEEEVLTHPKGKESDGPHPTSKHDQLAPVVTSPPLPPTSSSSPSSPPPSGDVLAKPSSPMATAGRGTSAEPPTRAADHKPPVPRRPSFEHWPPPSPPPSVPRPTPIRISKVPQSPEGTSLTKPPLSPRSLSLGDSPATSPSSSVMPPHTSIAQPHISVTPPHTSVTPPHTSSAGGQHRTLVSSPQPLTGQSQASFQEKSEGAAPSQPQPKPECLTQKRASVCEEETQSQIHVETVGGERCQVREDEERQTGAPRTQLGVQNVLRDEGGLAKDATLQADLGKGVTTQESVGEDTATQTKVAVTGAPSKVTDTGQAAAGGSDHTCPDATAGGAIAASRGSATSSASGLGEPLQVNRTSEPLPARTAEPLHVKNISEPLQRNITAEPPQVNSATKPVLLHNAADPLQVKNTEAPFQISGTTSWQRSPENNQLFSCHSEVDQECKTGVVGDYAIGSNKGSLGEDTPRPHIKGSKAADVTNVEICPAGDTKKYSNEDVRIRQIDAAKLSASEITNVISEGAKECHSEESVVCRSDHTRVCQNDDAKVCQSESSKTVCQVDDRAKEARASAELSPTTNSSDSCPLQISDVDNDAHARSPGAPPEVEVESRPHPPESSSVTQAPSPQQESQRTPLGVVAVPPSSGSPTCSGVTEPAPTCSSISREVRLHKGEEPEGDVKLHVKESINTQTEARLREQVLRREEEEEEEPDEEVMKGDRLTGQGQRRGETSHKSPKESPQHREEPPQERKDEEPMMPEEELSVNEEKGEHLLKGAEETCVLQDARGGRMLHEFQEQVAQDAHVKHSRLDAFNENVQETSKKSGLEVLAMKNEHDEHVRGSERDEHVMGRDREHVMQRVLGKPELESEHRVDVLDNGYREHEEKQKHEEHKVGSELKEHVLDKEHRLKEDHEEHVSGQDVLEEEKEHAAGAKHRGLALEGKEPKLEDVSEKDAPEEGTPEEGTPEGVPVEDSPEEEAPEEDALEEDTPEEHFQEEESEDTVFETAEEDSGEEMRCILQLGAVFERKRERDTLPSDGKDKNELRKDNREGGTVAAAIQERSALHGSAHLDLAVLEPECNQSTVTKHEQERGGVAQGEQEPETITKYDHEREAVPGDDQERKAVPTGDQELETVPLLDHERRKGVIGSQKLDTMSHVDEKHETMAKKDHEHETRVRNDQEHGTVPRVSQERETVPGDELEHKREPQDRGVPIDVRGQDSTMQVEQEPGRPLSKEDLEGLPKKEQDSTRIEERQEALAVVEEPQKLGDGEGNQGSESNKGVITSSSTTTALRPKPRPSSRTRTQGRQRDIGIAVGDADLRDLLIGRAKRRRSSKGSPAVDIHEQPSAVRTAAEIFAIRLCAQLFDFHCTRRDTYRAGFPVRRVLQKVAAEKKAAKEEEGEEEKPSSFDSPQAPRPPVVVPPIVIVPPAEPPRHAEDLHRTSETKVENEVEGVEELPHVFSGSTGSVATVVRVDTPLVSIPQPPSPCQDIEEGDSFEDASEGHVPSQQQEDTGVPFVEELKPCETTPTPSSPSPEAPPSVVGYVPKAPIRPCSSPVLHPGGGDAPSRSAPEDGSSSSGGHVTDPDLVASASASASMSSTGSEMSWPRRGPVARRDQPVEESEEELRWQCPMFSRPPDSDDTDRTGYESDDDFDTMDLEMKRLEAKLQQFEKELCGQNDSEGQLPKSSAVTVSTADEEDGSGKLKVEWRPKFRTQDLEALKCSPLPEVYPAADYSRTRHFSLMTRQEIDEYADSESDSDLEEHERESSSNDSYDFLFVKTKIKLKPGERRCRSCNLKRPKNLNIFNDKVQTESSDTFDLGSDITGTGDSVDAGMEGTYKVTSPQMVVSSDGGPCEACCDLEGRLVYDDEEIPPPFLLSEAPFYPPPPPPEAFLQLPSPLSPPPPLPPPPLDYVPHPHLDEIPSPPPGFGCEEPSGDPFFETAAHLLTTSEVEPVGEGVEEEEEDDEEHLLGYIWQEEDGMTAVDFEGMDHLAQFSGSDAVMFLFEDDLEEEEEEEEGEGDYEDESLSSTGTKEAPTEGRVPDVVPPSKPKTSFSFFSKLTKGESPHQMGLSFKNSFLKSTLGTLMRGGGEGKNAKQQSEGSRLGACPPPPPLPSLAVPPPYRAAPYSAPNSPVGDDTLCFGGAATAPVTGVYNVQSGHIGFPLENKKGSGGSEGQCALRYGAPSCGSSDAWGEGGEYRATPAVCVNTSDEDPAAAQHISRPAWPQTVPHHQGQRQQEGHPQQLHEQLPSEQGPCTGSEKTQLTQETPSTDVKDGSWFTSTTPAKVAPPVPPRAFRGRKTSAPKWSGGLLTEPSSFPSPADKVPRRTTTGSSYDRVFEPTEKPDFDARRATCGPEMQFCLVGTPQTSGGSLCTSSCNESDSHSYDRESSGGGTSHSCVGSESDTRSKTLPRYQQPKSLEEACLHHPDGAGVSHRPTSLKQLKRRQQEKQLKLEAEDCTASAGCATCVRVPLRRGRTPDEGLHQRRCSPHPRAPRRSWPPRK